MGRYLTGRDSAPITVFSPNETVNYVSVHDNATLMDKISSGAPNASDAERIQMNALAFGIIATSQGILLLDEGQEFGRTKHGNENSYATNDPTINPLQWGLKQTNQQLFAFYRGMIALRKSHPAFRMTDSAMIESDLHFLLATDHQIIYQIKAHANNDKWGTIMVVLNASPTVLTSKLGAGQWYLAVNGLQTYPSSEARVNHTITIKPFSMAVLYQK